MPKLTRRTFVALTAGSAAVAAAPALPTAAATDRPTQTGASAAPSVFAHLAGTARGDWQSVVAGVGAVAAEQAGLDGASPAVR